MVEVTGLNVFLLMLPSGQHYWLNVTPVGNGTGQSWNTTTSGTHCVGTPRGNDQNAFFNSITFGTYFTSTANEGQPYDYSNGVIGTVVPEPATVALLAFGVGALLIAVRLPVLLIMTPSRTDAGEADYSHHNHPPGSARSCIADVCRPQALRE